MEVTYWAMYGVLILIALQSSTNPFKIAVLKDPSGVVQPITVRPELAQINNKTVLYVGTGRYLGTSDLTNTQVQTIYAINDDPCYNGYRLG